MCALCFFFCQPQWSWILVVAIACIFFVVEYERNSLQLIVFFFCQTESLVFFIIIRIIHENESVSSVSQFHIKAQPNSNSNCTNTKKDFNLHRSHFVVEKVLYEFLSDFEACSDITAKQKQTLWMKKNDEISSYSAVWITVFVIWKSHARAWRTFITNHKLSQFIQFGELTFVADSDYPSFSSHQYSAHFYLKQLFILLQITSR